MPTLRIEHRVADYDSWKRDAFDADPLDRVGAGVRRHCVSRAADDPNYVLVDLDFATLPEAQAMQAALRTLWLNPLVQIGAPQARIIETVETQEN